MSVFTTVEKNQLEHFLKRYELGCALALEPIAAGITNTNYYLDTEAGRFVLTLYEHHSDDELEYMLGLQQHLAGRGVRCAAPVKDRRGDYFSPLKQRPAAIIQRLPGDVRTAPGITHCACIGDELARFHLAGQDFEPVRDNPRGIEWLLAVGDMLETELGSNDLKLYKATLQECQAFDEIALPRGPIHADLFHDNVLFKGDTISGVVDFDYACNDCLVFDIAVAINDWCVDKEGGLKQELVRAFLNAYQQRRRLSYQEIDALPRKLRLGALRFWLSRLYDRVFPMSGELTFSKDPVSFRDMLKTYSKDAKNLQSLFLPHYVG